MSFGQSIATCMSKYADFSGRASRSEYWYFYLFTFVLSVGLAMVGGVIGVEWLSGIASLGLALPNLAAMVRRLHDTGRSGWWYFIVFTCIGIFPLLYWLASKGEDGSNAYGPGVT